MDAPSLLENDRDESKRGDAIRSGSALLGEAAVLIWNDVAPEAHEQFYRWHDNEHIPERLALPGFCRGRRFTRPGAFAGMADDVRGGQSCGSTSPAYLARLNAPTPATLATARHFRNTSRAVCRVVDSRGSSTGGHVLAMRIFVDSAQSEPMRRYLCNVAIPRALRLTGVVACHLYAADRSVSYVDTAESTARAFDVPAWALLCEATKPDAASEAGKLIGEGELERLGARVVENAAVYALEICRLSSALQTQHHGKDHSGRSGAAR